MPPGCGRRRSCSPAACMSSKQPTSLTRAPRPGRKQVGRTPDTKGIPQHDTIALAEETGPPGAAPLLVEVMRDGRTVRPDGLDEMRTRCRERLALLPPPLPALRGSGAFPGRRR